MPHFKPYSYEQTLLIPVDLKNQLQPGTFEFALNEIVDEMDLSVFDGRFRNDETGAPAYHPAILLKIVLFAYSRGITSSREIERACRENVRMLLDGGIDAYLPDNQLRKRDPAFRTARRHRRSVDRKKMRYESRARYFKASEFTYDETKGKLICPAGKELYLKNRNFRERKGYCGISYMAKKTDCRVC
jgi:hypothetical protein